MTFRNEGGLGEDQRVNIKRQVAVNLRAKLAEQRRDEGQYTRISDANQLRTDLIIRPMADEAEQRIAAVLEEVGPMRAGYTGGGEDGEDGGAGALPPPIAESRNVTAEQVNRMAAPALLNLRGKTSAMSDDAKAALSNRLTELGY